jgi:hypothetical protein
VVKRQGGCDPDPSRIHAAILTSFRCVAA